ncbi:MAG: DUF559 domain-containing protein [Chitinophagaceae bacterium]|nr:DUF559 domain-containing protein [Chitinophagaceae bacterium]
MYGLKFRRQHPIGLYIADFYCHKAKLGKPRGWTEENL